MCRTIAALTASCMLATFSAVAWGQAGVEYGHPTYPNTPSSAWQHHASTVQEGSLRGLSNVIDAMGNFQLSHSQARILMEVARTMHLDNEVKRVDAFYQRQYALERARDQRRARAEAKREAGRLRRALRERGVLLATYALSPDEFDATSGAVEWPPILRHPSYAGRRAEIESQLAGLAGGADDASRSRLHGLELACAQFKDQLREDYRQSPVFHTPEGIQKHVELQKFLTGVRYAGLSASGGLEQIVAGAGQPNAPLLAGGQ